MGGALDIALVHHPVLNRNGEEISARIDEFDVFDGCRLALTYGVRSFFIVNPTPAQRDLAHRLIAHGQRPDRDPARGVFDNLKWAASLDDAIAALPQARRLVVSTSAAASECTVSFADVRARRAEGSDVLLVIGKAWGLAPRVFSAADLRLEPIDGGQGYNHLSVRSAMAILVDRLSAGTQ